MVKQIAMKNAEQDKPHIASKIDVGGPSQSLAMFDATGEQDYACAE